MAEIIAQLRATVARYRVQTALIAAAAIAVFVFVVVGVRLHRSAEPLRVETSRLGATVSEIDAFRSAFIPSTPESDARVQTDSVSVAVARDDRVALAQEVAARAEALGLSSVRVRFTPADSAMPPQTPAFSAVASYALTLDADGSLGDVLSLLRRLPPSVALTRLGAVRAHGTTRHHLSFAVLEATPDTRNADIPLTRLMAFAKPLSDSLPAAAAGTSTPLSRDPFGAVVRQPVVRLAARPLRPVPKVDAPAWDVTATLIAGARRAALINGVLVSVGEAVTGGVKLTVVERDRVVLTDQKGAAHTIAVKEGER